MADTDAQTCENCKRDIPSSNFMMHEIYCRRNIALCSKCNEPIPKVEMETHNDEYHIDVSCDLCGINVEKCFIEEHKESCPKRSATCSYCQLSLPFSDMVSHQDYCGTRTERCEACSRYIMLKDQAKHEDTQCSYPPSTTRVAKRNNVDRYQPHAGTLYRDTLNSVARHDNPFSSLCDDSDGTGALNNGRLHAGGGSHRTQYEEDLLLAMSLSNDLHQQTQPHPQGSDETAATSPGADVDALPCEFCERIFAINELFNHQEYCSAEAADTSVFINNHLSGDVIDDGGGRRDLSDWEDDQQHGPALRTRDNSYTNGAAATERHSHSSEGLVPSSHSHRQDDQHTTSAPHAEGGSDELMLPCEFCSQCFPVEQLTLHQTGCELQPHGLFSDPISNRFDPLMPEPSAVDRSREDSNPSRPMQPTSAEPGTMDGGGVGGGDDAVLLPCEICDAMVAVSEFNEHQTLCRFGDTDFFRDSSSNASSRPTARSSRITNPLHKSSPRHRPLPTLNKNRSSTYSQLTQKHGFTQASVPHTTGTSSSKTMTGKNNTSRNLTKRHTSSESYMTKNAKDSVNELTTRHSSLSSVQQASPSALPRPLVGQARGRGLPREPLISRHLPRQQSLNSDGGAAGLTVSGLNNSRQVHSQPRYIKPTVINHHMKSFDDSSLSLTGVDAGVRVPNRGSSVSHDYNSAAAIARGYNPTTTRSQSERRAPVRSKTTRSSNVGSQHDTTNVSVQRHNSYDCAELSSDSAQMMPQVTRHAPEPLLRQTSARGTNRENRGSNRSHRRSSGSKNSTPR